MLWKFLSISIIDDKIKIRLAIRLKRIWSCQLALIHTLLQGYSVPTWLMSEEMDE